MITERINIDVRPGGVPVVIHVTQYEAGLRQFIFTPYASNGELTVVAGSATLEGTKPDGYAFQQACQMIDGVITYTLQEQLCAVEGRVWSRLVVRDANGGMIGYTAIVWVVGRAGVADDAVMSDSDISALQQFLDQFGEIDAYRGALDQALASIAAESGARIAQDAVLSARMDSFARLPDGGLSTAADAELVDIRVMTNGATAATAGDAVREQVSGLESITNRLISNNLAGNEVNTPYPVYIPAGTTITVSTSDGSVFPTGGTLRLLLLDEDGAQTDYWSLANNASYRTFTTNASKADTYYIAWNEQPSVPLMVNFGANADPYVPYVTPITSKVDKLDSAVEGINAGLATFKASWFANEVQAVTAEYVTFYGKKTASNNYKCAKYPVRDGSLKVRVDSIFVYWSSSQYNVFAAYNDDDEFIGGLKNSEVNTTTTGGTYTNVEWDIPKGTSYILVSFARMSDKTEISTISEYGYNLPNPNERIFNQSLSSEYKQQFYFHVATSELGDYNSLAFNAKLVTESPVEYYDIYFTGYDQDYSGRTFLAYKTGLTKGINGNEIVIAENFQNLANSIKSKYWNGVVLNLKYAASSLDSGRWLRVMPLYAITSEYLLLNDTALSLAYYPESNYTPISKEYHAPYNPMYGGYLCAIGDSLTGAYYKSADETWCALIAKWNCMDFDNLGISGNPMAKSDSYASPCMAERVDDLDTAKRYTHIFVMGGANDYNHSIPIGTNTDTEITTFKGAINHIIAKLTEKFPSAKIVFGTTYRRVASYADKPYADAMMEVCKLHSIPCLNNYENSGVQFFDANWMARFGAENQLGNNHLNAAGDLFVAPRIENALKYGVD